jgi:pyruvate formate lyase activating enzyme
MRISGLEKMSLVDYDGKVCATIFTGGCNFLCPFCQNSPLVIDFKAQPVIDEEYIFDYLTKRKGILDGLCISGGEPTLQPDLIPFIERVKSLGYAVKLDTNGTNPDLIKTLHENGLVDYFAMDIKNDIEHYAQIIGFDKYDTKKVEQSVDYFVCNNVDYEFRTTLVSEFHQLENITAIGEWLKGASKYFLQKFKDTGSCIASGLSAVSDADVIKYLSTLKKTIKNVHARGYDL